MEESFLLQKKKMLDRNRYICLEFKNEIGNHNKFEILCEALGNEESSADSIVEKVHQHF